jgi:hypothetical protein
VAAIEADLAAGAAGFAAGAAGFAAAGAAASSSFFLIPSFSRILLKRPMTNIPFDDLEYQVSICLLIELYNLKTAAVLTKHQYFEGFQARVIFFHRI